MGKVDPHLAYETMGMISARRWSELSTAVFAGTIKAALGWEWALFFLAVALTIRFEIRRVREALWPTSYHVTRLIMNERGFERGSRPGSSRRSIAWTCRRARTAS